MHSRTLPLAAALSILAGCVTAPILPSAASLDRSPAFGAGMVSAPDPRAAAAGVEMLRAGGSAADAAFATLVALTVVEPQSSGIGGGGFLVYEDGDGTPSTYDGREKAPAAADGAWFYRDGKPMDIDAAIPGGKSVGVPGNIRMMALAHRDQGRLSWGQLFLPAIRLARQGFAITPRLHRALGSSRETAALSADARALFYGPDGNPLPVGTMVRNPALAGFLARLALSGPDNFYSGRNAQAIVATVNGAARNPSRMTVADVAAYEAKPRPPVCGAYRGHRICGMGPPSSGATTVFAILKQLERFDLAALGPNSPTSWHLIAESTRVAFADRDRYLADPDFAQVPVAGLVDPAYLAGRSALIAPDRSLDTVSAGNPAGAPRVTAGVTPDLPGTSHFVAVDRWGEVASLTSTIESVFGSGLMVSGYYLNNELTDFSLVPSVDGVPVANRVGPGKRPRSSMSPTIVYGPDGRVRLAVGAAGGATIIAQVSRAIIGVVDWKLTAQQALALPVVFAPGDIVFVERGTSLEGMIPALRALGHAKIGFREPGSFKANAIERVGDRWVGAADPRSEGVAAGE
ncbi:MAG: gamma-glutamyltransferase family protein [Sphingomonas sp.]|nr:gamma-glutamyltransferase family protein [Sphingomonas sp.]